MVDPVRDTAAMIAGMDPALDPGPYIFTSWAPETAGRLLDRAFALIREEEGITLILPFDTARAAGADLSLPMARITLRVHSALDGVGLTAAVATELAQAGIPCNMVAGFHHDHAFVPAARADKALVLLRARAESA
jgi:hypothetical protein